MELFQNDKPFRLYGDHFICNIALADNSPGGIIATERDPRKFKRKPDTYVGRVERISPDCRMVRPGNRIVIERFDWLQYDLDEERLIAREVDVVILEDDKPAPGIAVLQEVTDIEKSQPKLYIPDASFETEKREKGYLHGEIIHSSVDELKIGNLIWMYKRDRDQWRLGQSLVIFRFSLEMVFAIGERSNVKPPLELSVV